MRFRVGEIAILLYCRTNPHIEPCAGEIVTVEAIGPYAPGSRLEETGKITFFGGDYLVQSKPGSERCVLDAQLAKINESDPDSSVEVREEEEEAI
jgi:hypothetical protein